MRNISFIDIIASKKKNNCLYEFQNLQTLIDNQEKFKTGWIDPIIGETK